MKARLAGSHVSEQLVLAPRDRRARQRGQRRRFPAFGKSAGKITARDLGAEFVARRVAGAAMAKAFDEIGAAIPHF